MIILPRATSLRTSSGSRPSTSATYRIASVTTPRRAWCICVTELPFAADMVSILSGGGARLLSGWGRRGLRRVVFRSRLRERRSEPQLFPHDGASPGKEPVDSDQNLLGTHAGASL